MSESPGIEVDKYESVNEFAVVGEFGFHRFEGPFEVGKSGTIWCIFVPKDSHPDVVNLDHQIGESAAITADCEIVGGGVLIDIDEGPRVSHVLIDQYAMGDPQ